MGYRIVFVALVLAAVGCQPDLRPEPPPTPEASLFPTPTEAAHVVDIGDVEAGVRLEGILAERSQASNVEEERFETRKGDLMSTTITVRPPFPESLWLTFRVNASRGFRTAPVALRAKILVEEEERGGFTAVLDAEAARSVYEKTVDVLAGLEGPPETMLAYAQAEAVLLPEGTEAAMVAPATATGPPERCATITGNPVRINFVKGPTE